MRNVWIVSVFVLACDKSNAPAPIATDDPRAADLVDVPRGWIKEHAELAAALPRKALSIQESWEASGSLELHCYELGFAERDPHVAGTRAILNRMGAVGDLFPTVRGEDFHVALAADPRFEEGVTLFACWRLIPKAASRIVDFAATIPLIESLRALDQQLGPPEKVTLRRVTVTGTDVNVQYPLDEARLERAAQWLEANGFKGTRAAGWTRIPDEGPRTIVEVSHVDIRDVVIVLTTEGAK